MRFDMLLKGGHVIDAANGVDGIVNTPRKASRVISIFLSVCVEGHAPV